MKEFAFVIEEATRNGLVPHSQYQPGAPFAGSMKNLRPGAYAAVAPTWWTAPFTFSLDWPFPQVFRGENVTLLFGETSVSTLASDWAATPLTTMQSDDRGETMAISADGVWHVATFEDVWFGTNGTSLVFKVPSYCFATLVANGLSAQTLCAHQDRLVLAGLSGSWFSGTRWQTLFKRWRQTQPQFAHDQQSWSTRWIVWGERLGGAKDIPFWTLLAALGLFGNDVFDALEPSLLKRIEQGEIGFASIRSLGAPVYAAPLGSDVALYSREARAVLMPTDGPNYFVASALGEGAASRSTVCGDARGHAWLSPRGRLMHNPVDGAVRDLRQEEVFTTPANWIASFDSFEREHWFSTATNAYVLNTHGVGGPLDLRPTSLCRADGALVGAGAGHDASTVSVEFWSHDVNMNSSDNKRVQQVAVQQSGLSSLEADVTADGVASMGAVQTNDNDIGYPVRSGVKLQIGVKGTANVGTDYAVQRLEVRFQAEGRQHRRGATGAAPDA